MPPVGFEEGAVRGYSSPWTNTMLRPIGGGGGSCSVPLLVRGCEELSALEVNEDDKDDLQHKAPPGSVLRTMKIRAYPDSDQRKVIDTWYRATNNAYNRAAEILNRDYPTRVVSKLKIRNMIVPEDETPLSSVWVLQVASRMRAQAVFQAAIAHKTGVEKLRKTGKGFKLKFRSRLKDPKRCVVLEGGKGGPVKGFHIIDRKGSNKEKTWFGMKVSWGDKGWGKKELGGGWSMEKLGAGVDPVLKLRDKRKVAHKLIKDRYLAHDGKLLYDKRVDGYWFIATFSVPVKSGGINASTARVSCLDPGTRTFNTYILPDGTHGELLEGELKHMEKCTARLDSMYSSLARERIRRDHQVENNDGERLCRRRYRKRRDRMKRRINKIAHHMRCRMHNAHYDAIHVLLDASDFILVPKFETRKMVRKAERVINNKVARAMYTWGHFTFRQRLASKVEMDRSKHMRVVGEPGTSKTCGNCGHWNEHLKGKKVLECRGCGVEMNRDVNGARNNLLAELTYVLRATNRM